MSSSPRPLLAGLLLQDEVPFILVKDLPAIVAVIVSLYTPTSVSYVPDGIGNKVPVVDVYGGRVL